MNHRSKPAKNSDSAPEAIRSFPRCEHYNEIANMDVVVRLINVNGKPLKAKDRKAGPSYSGKLRVREDRLNLLGRAFVQAELISKVDGQESLMLPPLVDAQLLWVEASSMRITGMEVVASIQYYQTWEIEVRSC